MGGRSEAMRIRGPGSGGRGSEAVQVGQRWADQGPAGGGGGGGVRMMQLPLCASRAPGLAGARAAAQRIGWGGGGGVSGAGCRVAGAAL